MFLAMLLVLMLIFSLGITAAYRFNWPTRPVFLYPLICSLIVTGGFIMWEYHVIATSKSSTAAIGLFFLPIYSAVVAVLSFFVSCALGILLYVVRGYRVEKKDIARHRLLHEAVSRSGGESSRDEKGDSR
jgi:prolipoprotein diacylglyceryltransferase